MSKTIWFDMDGTIADLYGVENWLSMLRASDATPYAVAKPLLRLSTLAYMLNRLQAKGYRLGVISWLSKNGTSSYGADVTSAKMAWLKKHLPSVAWDEINIVPYGIPKQNFCYTPSDILFDDEKPNRDSWLGIAHDVNDIIGVLKTL